MEQTWGSRPREIVDDVDRKMRQAQEKEND